MDLVEKYLDEAVSHAKGFGPLGALGRTQYTPGDIVKVDKVKTVKKELWGMKGTVTKNLSSPGKKEYHIEVKLDNGKEVVLKNDEVVIVKLRRL